MGDIQATARCLKLGTTWLVAGLIVVLLLETAAGAGLFGANPRLGAFALGLLFAVPAMLNLAALWRIRQALAAVASGAMFAPVLSRVMRQVGILLFLGAACAVLAMPALHRVAGAAYPRLIEFDLANTVLGAIGVAFSFIARLFERAAEIESELEEMF